tara:strand:+ start:990 stop:2147 length:1158 start_codon:yes stop_codon:yes gene_type:complete
MGLLNQTQQKYYRGTKQSFTGDGTTRIFVLNLSEPGSLAFPTSINSDNVSVYIDNVLQADVSRSNTIFSIDQNTTGAGDTRTRLIFTPGNAPSNGANIDIYFSNSFGNYQFISLDDIIAQFRISYVGEDKIIPKVKRTDIIFHAKRALQELSYDTLKSIKGLEFTVPSTLTMPLPQDYVNYVKLVSVDSSGIEHVLYPTGKTSNPFNPEQNTDGSFKFDLDDDNIEDSETLLPESNSDTWDSYKSTTPSDNNDDYEDDTFWPHVGGRYGLSPQHAQTNGSFFIDELKGIIHFSSNISGKTVIIKYISDSLATDSEMVIHKLAEEAIYKCMAYAIISTRANVQEYIVNRFRREKIAATRKAKLRLSNIKLEELTRILRGRSKQIKH